MIKKVINTLGSKKAHGCDGISVRMIKLCGDSTVTPLKSIFEQTLKFETYPDLWKKTNVVIVYKKESKNLIKN